MMRETISVDPKWLVEFASGSLHYKYSPPPLPPSLLDVPTLWMSCTPRKLRQTTWMLPSSLIHLTEPPGDIMVFLTGQEEIDTSCERMKSLGPEVPDPPCLLHPPQRDEDQDFRSHPSGQEDGGQSNISKTLLTLYYVGFVNQKVYNSKSGLDALVVTPISQVEHLKI